MFFSVFVEDLNLCQLSTWLKALAPYQGLRACRVTLYPGRLSKNWGGFGNLNLFLCFFLNILVVPELMTCLVDFNLL